MLLNIRLIIISFLLISGNLLAQLSSPYYQNNDNVAFVGNSITRNGEFYTIVSLFQATRFPHIKMKINNYGCGGNQCIDVMERVEGDIMEFNPNSISMMLGMNDVVRANYTASKKVNGVFPESLIAAQQTANATYFQRMRILVNTFKSKGQRIILQSPTMFDEKLYSPTASLDLCNKPLGLFRDSVQRWAKEFGYPFVDYYSILNKIDSTEKLRDTTFTIVSSDRIHPGTLGHFVMAYAYLKALNMPSLVSDVKINATNGSVTLQDNALVNFVNLNNIIGGTFSVLSKALPMPVITGAEAALNWNYFDFYNELNREMLTITGLVSTKTYTLKIADRKVGDFSGAELAAGINLAKYYTPQKGQSVAISNLLYAKRALESKRRSMRSCEYQVLTEQEFATLSVADKMSRVIAYNNANPGKLVYYGTYETDRPMEDSIVSMIHTIEAQVEQLQQLKEYEYSISEKTNTTTESIEDFEYNDVNIWKSNPATGTDISRVIISNPLVNSTNSSPKALKIVKNTSATAATWNNVYSTFYHPTLTKSLNTFEMKVLLRAAENPGITTTNVQIRVGASTSAITQTVKVMDNWQTIRFSYASLSEFATKFAANKDTTITTLNIFPRADADQTKSVVLFVDDIKLVPAVSTSLAMENFESNNIGVWKHNANTGIMTKDIVSNPIKDSYNSSDNVMKITKTGGSNSFSWNNVYSNYYTPTLSNENCIVQLKALFTTSENTVSTTNVAVRLGDSYSNMQQTLSAANTWQTLRFDYSKNSSFAAKFNQNGDSTITSFNFFPRVDTDQASSVTVYVDDIEVVSKSSNIIAGIDTVFLPTVVYNPETDLLYIKNLSGDNNKYSITNITGVICAENTINYNSAEINMTSFKNGVYFFTITTPLSRRFTRKIVKL